MTEHLTDAEREALFTAGDHHPDVCDCSAYAEEYAHEVSDRMCDAFNDTVVAVEAILAARVQALREQIAQAWDNGVVHGRCCPSEFVTTPCLSNPYREGVGGE